VPGSDVIRIPFISEFPVIIVFERVSIELGISNNVKPEADRSAQKHFCEKGCYNNKDDKTDSEINNERPAMKQYGD
jgi:hypothetical protein